MAKLNGGQEMTYDPEGQVYELKSLSEFDGVMSAAEGKVVAVCYHNSCPTAE